MVISQHYEDVIRYFQPKAYIPSATTISRTIHRLANDTRQSILQLLESTGQMVSLVVDSWTPPGMKYTVFGVLCFFVDSQWNTRHFCLGFQNVSGGQTGEHITQYIASLVKAHQLHQRVLSITADNGAHIDIVQITNAITSLGNTRIRHRISYLRCFAHIINLVC